MTRNSGTVSAARREHVCCGSGGGLESRRFEPSTQRLFRLFQHVPLGRAAPFDFPGPFGEGKDTTGLL